MGRGSLDEKVFFLFLVFFFSLLFYGLWIFEGLVVWCASGTSDLCLALDFGPGGWLPACRCSGREGGGTRKRMSGVGVHLLPCLGLAVP